MLLDATVNPDVILVAEDEETDAFILQQAWRKTGLPQRVIVVGDGEDVVAYLNGEGKYGNREQFPLPCLLLLDLKMPRMTGFDVLQWLTSRPEFSEIPRVILSSSSHESDVEHARQLGASEYHVKPNSMASLTEILREIHARWLAPINR